MAGKLTANDRARLRYARELVDGHLKGWPAVREQRLAQACVGQLQPFTLEMMEGTDRLYSAAVKVIEEFGGESETLP